MISRDPLDMVFLMRCATKHSLTLFILAITARLHGAMR